MLANLQNFVTDTIRCRGSPRYCLLTSHPCRILGRYRRRHLEIVMSADNKGPRPDYVEASERGVDPKVIRDEHRPGDQHEIAERLVNAGLQSISKMPKGEAEALLKGDARVVAENVMREGRSQLTIQAVDEHGGVIRASTEAKAQSIVDRALDPKHSDPLAVDLVIDILADRQIVASS
eukprot:jgi/Botrbrau1/15206/Bobra.0149s0065.1